MRIKTVIFLNYIEDLRKVIPYIKGFSRELSEDTIVISSNFDHTVLSEHFDFKIVYFNELLSKEDYEFMDNYVYNLAENWYQGLPAIRGLTEYNEIQFGRLTELYAQQLFSNSIKNLELILKSVKEFAPDRIIFIEQRGLNLLEGLANFVNHTLKIRALYIRVSSGGNSLFSLLNKFYRFSIDLFCSILDNLVAFTVPKDKGSKTILMDCKLISEIKNVNKDFPVFPYTIESGLSVRLGLFFRNKSLFLSLSKFDCLRFYMAPFLFYRNRRFFKMHFKKKINFKYRDLAIEPVLERSFERLIINTFPRLYKNTVFVGKFLRKICPSLVVLREAVRELEKTLAFAAKQQGIPTVVIQHGANNVAGVYAKLDTDYIALWGPADKEWYRANGNDVTGAKVTGNPSYDGLYQFKLNNSLESSKEILAKAGLNKDKPIITYLANFVFMGDCLPVSVFGMPDYSEFCFKIMLDAAKDHSDKQFIFKLHPYYNRKYRPMIDKGTKGYPNIVVVRDIDLYELFNASSLIISELFSTAIIPALFLDKPVISLNFFKNDEPLPLAKRGVALEVRRPQDLSCAIHTIFNNMDLNRVFDSNRKSYVYDYAYKMDGMATDRLKEFMGSLYNDKFSSGEGIATDGKKEEIFQGCSLVHRK